MYGRFVFVSQLNKVGEYQIISRFTFDPEKLPGLYNSYLSRSKMTIIWHMAMRVWAQCIHTHTHTLHPSAQQLQPARIFHGYNVYNGI